MLTENEYSKDEDLDKYLGVLAKDIPEEIVLRLLEEGYSVSPKSGRIRRRFRRKESKPKFYKRKKYRRYATTVAWIIIIIVFIVTLIIVLKESEIQPSPKKKIMMLNKNNYVFPSVKLSSSDYNFALILPMRRDFIL